MLSGNSRKSPQTPSQSVSPKVRLNKNAKVDLKIEELKKNLLKNKQTLTIAKDLENDTQEKINESRSAIKTAKIPELPTNLGGVQSLNHSFPGYPAQDIQRMMSPYSFPPVFGPAVTPPSFYPVPVQMVTDPRTGSVQYQPVNYPTMPLSLPPNQNMFNMLGLSSPVTSVESDTGCNRRHSLPNSVFNTSLGEMQPISSNTLSHVRPKSAERLLSKPRKRIKRTKSGSSLDFKTYSITDTIDIEKPSENLEAMGLELQGATSLPKPKLYNRSIDNCDSVEISPRSGISVSPAVSPQLSKDSGFSAPKMSRLKGIKSGGAATLMDKLLSTESIQHQKVMGRVVSLIREEFAFDGYMENGIEDLAIGRFKIKSVK